MLWEVRLLMLKMLRHLRNLIYPKINILLFFFYIAPRPRQLSELNNSLLYVEEQTSFSSSQYVPFKRNGDLTTRHFKNHSKSILLYCYTTFGPLLQNRVSQKKILWNILFKCRQCHFLMWHATPLASLLWSVPTNISLSLHQARFQLS